MRQYTYTGPTAKCPYYVYVPQRYRTGDAVPLLVMLHGCTQKAVDFAANTHMNELAERYNFIVVYPQQMRSANELGCWNWFKSVNQARDSGEAALIAGIVLAVLRETEQWRIDARRVYVAGISAGGAMAGILGATYPDLFAAIGVHSGVAYRCATNIASSLWAMRRGGRDHDRLGALALSAMDSRAHVMPTIVFHGTKDLVVSPINGAQVIQQWMLANMQLSKGYVADLLRPARTVTGKVPEGYSYVIQSWDDVHGREIQEYWRVNGMGHAWSGGSGGSYMDPKGPDASEAMYRFFMQHTLKQEERRAPVAATKRLTFWKKLLHNVVDFLYEKKEE
jgi:poly(hydroxyalkanoate) depolymerase family esterase